MPKLSPASLSSFNHFYFFFNFMITIMYSAPPLPVLILLLHLPSLLTGNILAPRRFDHPVSLPITS